MSRYGRSRYAAYEQPDEVGDLNRNVYDGARATVFPNNIYLGQVQLLPYYACSRPRDTDFQYIIGAEREEHPDHFSRFGYAKCPNGYCSGHWPGRYNAPVGCESFEPPDMAPPRLYAVEHTDSSSVLSRGYASYSAGKAML